MLLRVTVLGQYIIITYVHIEVRDPGSILEHSVKKKNRLHEA